MKKTDGRTPPGADLPPLRFEQFLEATWLQRKKCPVLQYADVVAQRTTFSTPDTPEVREHLLDYREERTQEAKIIRSWERQKRQGRTVMDAEMARAREAALEDPALEFQILQREKSLRDAALTGPNAFTRMRQVQNEAENKAFSQELERVHRQARAWRRNFYGNEK
jgi:hypothetical protein